MTSKRELEAKIRLLEDENRGLKKMEAWRDAACDQRDAARDQVHRYRDALKRLAKHYGFHDAYVREERFLVDPGYSGPREHAVTGYRNVFSPDALIADLDAIDNAAAADEARARLGITKEEA